MARSDDVEDFTATVEVLRPPTPRPDPTPEPPEPVPTELALVAELRAWADEAAKGTPYPPGFLAAALRNMANRLERADARRRQER